MGHEQLADRRRMEKMRVLGMGVALLLVSGIVLFHIRLGKNGLSYKLDPDAQDGSYRLQPEQPSPPDGFRKPIQVQVNGEAVADGDRRCNLMAGNPQENAWDLRVTVRLDESGEELYRSGVLKPGEREAYVTLSRELEPGSYPATAGFTALDRDNGKAVGTVEAGITIVVIN